MATYVNDLRLKEIATGDEAGTWGTSTNTNLQLIGEALGYGTQDCFASDADATTTVADGASDPARAMYFKVTSSATLTATRTLTIAPNTVSRVMLIENATTGSQSIAISQGSGGNVTIASGQTKMVYLDGAGATAAVIDALADLELGTITVANLTATTADINGGTIDGVTIGGSSAGAGTFTNLTATGTTTLAGASTTADITFGDNDKAIFGAGSDLQIYHDGSNSYITDSGTGNLRISGTLLQLNDASFNKYLLGSGDSVTLYNADSAKLETTATGIDVTGTVTADGLTVDGTLGNFSVSTGGNEATFDYNGFNYINSTGAGSALVFRMGSGNTNTIRLHSNSDVSFYDSTGSSQSFYWDASAESLGIGNSSPQARLDLTGAGGGSGVTFKTTDSSLNETFYIIDGGRVGVRYANFSVGIPRTTSLATNAVFQVEEAGLLTVLSTGNTGIGTSSPIGKLTVSASTNGAGMEWTPNSAGNAVSHYDRSTSQYINMVTRALNHIFAIGGTEAVRITSDGDLLVGATSATISNEMVYLLNDGRVGISAASTAPLVVNRKTNDGTIADFRKDGSPVGSIGVDGTRIVLEANNEAGVAFGDDRLYPRNSGNFSDNTVDIGSSSYRFKDLYLSGGVYLGGTGAANQLDDYEEGTWTPEYAPATGSFSSVTYIDQGGFYRKVGDIVFFMGRIGTSAISLGTASGGARVSGLPFTSINDSSNGRNAGSIAFCSAFGGDMPSGLSVEPNATYFVLWYRTSANGASVELGVSDLATSGTANRMYFSGFYVVA